MISKFFNVIELSLFRFRVNWFKTIYFNLRSLPFKTAIKLPIYIYSKTQFACLKGRVVIDGEQRRGMIRIGCRCDRGQGVTIIRNLGEIKLGDNVSIFQGCDILVGPNGLLEIKRNARVRENCFIYVSQFVSIGERTGIAYQSTISEDDYHFIVNTKTGEIKSNKSSIIIGDNNWIGSRTVIKKGTRTPNNTIVASSYSLLDKDYTKNVPEFSVLGGVPAKLLVTGYRRVFNSKSEQFVHEHYESTDEIFKIDLDMLDEFCK